MSPQLRDTGDIMGEIYMIISCWLGADVWMVTCCECDVSAHSQQTVHYHLRIICYLIWIWNNTNKQVKFHSDFSKCKYLFRLGIKENSLNNVKERLFLSVLWGAEHILPAHLPPDDAALLLQKAPQLSLFTQCVIASYCSKMPDWTWLPRAAENASERMKKQSYYIILLVHYGCK